MKTIGVLGGIGPQATIDFEARLHRVAQGLIEPHTNEGYPPLVSVYMRYPPVLVGPEGTPSDPLTVDPRLLDAARRLGQWADLLATPSNTPHYFAAEIEAAAGCELVSMIDATVAELQRRFAGTHSEGAAARAGASGTDAHDSLTERRVGLLGLRVPKIYSERLVADGFSIETAPKPQRGALNDAILRLMEGRETEQHRQAAADALGAVRATGVTHTVLGCTEIPLLLGETAEAPDLVNPAQLLAETVVRRAVEPD